MIVTKDSSKLVEKCIDLIGSLNHMEIQPILLKILDSVTRIYFAKTKYINEIQDDANAKNMELKMADIINHFYSVKIYEKSFEKCQNEEQR